MKRKIGSGLLVLGFLILTFSVDTAGAHKKHGESPAPAAAPAISEPPAVRVVEETPEAVSPTHPEPTLQPAREPVAEAPTATLFVSWVGRLHPTVIHFPIALLLAAAIAELLFAATSQVLFRHSVRFCLWGGAVGALVAAPLGWAFAASGATEPGWLLEAHRWTGTSASVGSIAVLWTNEHSERVGASRLLLRVLLALLGLLIASTGFLGGSLLYGIDHLVWGA